MGGTVKPLNGVGRPWVAQPSGLGVEKCRMSAADRTANVVRTQAKTVGFVAFGRKKSPSRECPEGAAGWFG